MASTGPEPTEWALAPRVSGPDARLQTPGCTQTLDGWGPVASTAVQERQDEAQDRVRRYVVRTFGCQMNEHDSERIAGLLEADGLVPAEDVGDADVVVLNTC